MRFTGRKVSREGEHPTNGCFNHLTALSAGIVGMSRAYVEIKENVGLQTASDVLKSSLCQCIALRHFLLVRGIIRYIQAV